MQRPHRPKRFFDSGLGTAEIPGRDACDVFLPLVDAQNVVAGPLKIDRQANADPSYP
jgi:hypothetical protein